MEQMNFEGEGFDLSSKLIIDNKDLVTDFFGDNKDWYTLLLQGGSTYKKISLDTQKEYDKDLADDYLTTTSTDLPPLDPEKITEERAKHIIAFFEENEKAKEAFMSYFTVNTQK